MAERIWLLIVEVINVIPEALNCATMALTEQVISDDKQIKAVKLAFNKLVVAAWRAIFTYETRGSNKSETW